MCYRSNVLIWIVNYIEESTFTLDGLPFDMWGLRVASASQSEANNTKVIKALNEYQEAGINTISVFIQGSSGGYSDPFHHGGSDIDPAHWHRLTRIIEACQRRRMVVIIGIFYQRTIRDENLRNLNSAQAIVSATRLVAQTIWNSFIGRFNIV